MSDWEDPPPELASQPALQPWLLRRPQGQREGQRPICLLLKCSCTSDPADQATSLEKTSLVRVKWLDGSVLSVRLQRQLTATCQDIKHLHTADGCAKFPGRPTLPRAAVTPDVEQANFVM